MMGSRSFWLAAIVGLGLLLRLTYFQTLVAAEYTKLMASMADMGSYWEWARHLSDGDWLNRDTYHPYFSWMREIAPLETWHRWWGDRRIFHQTPAYPYLLAALTAMSGNSAEFAILVQLLIGALFPAAVFLLARRLFEVRAALVAAAVTALYAPFIFHQGILLRDWLIPISQTIALLCLIRAQETGLRRLWLGAGIALGFSYLVKPTIMLFLPPAMVWIAWLARADLRSAVLRCALVVLGFVLALSPAILRNLAVGVHPLALSTRAAEPFIIGNAADGDPAGFFLVPPSMKRILEDSDGRLIPTIRATLRTFEGDVPRFLHFQLRKLKGLVNPYDADLVPLLRVLPGYGTVFCLGAVGLLWLRRREPAHWLLYLFLLATCASLWVGPMRARYRLALVPVLTIYGGALLVHIYDLMRHREWRSLTKAFALCAGLALAQYGPLALDDLHLYLPGSDYQAVANRYAGEGRYDRALGEIARLLARARATPGAEMAAAASVAMGHYRIAWASTLLDDGRKGDAIRQTNLAADAYSATPTLSQTHYNLGLLYSRLGDREKAKTSFERFLSLESTGEQADRVRRLLGVLALDEGFEGSASAAAPPR
jgi:hypothetical protein